MAESVPKVDPRTAADIRKQVDDLLKVYLATDSAVTPAGGGSADAWPPDNIREALAGIFARYAEIVIERLNRAPDKNLLAFLDLLGASLLPPQPARAPLTFSLAAGSVVDAVVPAGTQVAAPPAEGQKEPIIFETERELVATPAQLAAALTLDPERDMYADQRGLVTGPAVPGAAIFQASSRIEHSLYLGHKVLLAFPHISQLTLEFDLEEPLGDNGTLAWESPSGADWPPMTPAAPAPDLTTGGAKQITFDDVPAIPSHLIDSLDSRWLRARLLTPITPSDQVQEGKAQLPRLSNLKMQAILKRQADAGGLLPDAAYAGATPIDIGKAFYPFGERPRLNDALYLASAEAFSAGDAQSATAQIRIEVANPHLLPRSNSVWPSADLEIAWECWADGAWQRVGTGAAPDWLRMLELDQVPPAVAQDKGKLLVQGTALPGVSIEIRNMKTDQPAYPLVGDDRRFAAEISLVTGVNVIQAKGSFLGRTSYDWGVTFRGTPSIYLRVSSSGKPIADRLVQAEHVPLEVEEINLRGETEKMVRRLRITTATPDTETVTRDVTGPLTRFDIATVEGRNSVLIEGLLNDGVTVGAATAFTIGRPAKAPSESDFHDGTFGFCQDGMVTLNLPANTSKTVVNGQEGYWLRVRLARGDYGKDASYRIKDPLKPEDGFLLVPASHRPAIVSSVKIGYVQMLTAMPDIRAYNNLAFRNLTAVNIRGGGYLPFIAPPGQRPALYLGFTLPPGRKSFPNRTVSLYICVDDLKLAAGAAGIQPSSTEQVQVIWRYWDGQDWVRLVVRDETQGFTRSGLIEFLAPADFASRQAFGQEAYWLWAEWERGEYRVQGPRVRRVLLNTTVAAQAVTIRNEVLGSSDGGRSQCFRIARTPILQGQKLEVREPELPSTSEQAVIRSEEGDALAASRQAAGQRKDVWVRWHEVADFYASGPRDRHYVLDHLTGEIRFGDGLNGLIPPIGVGSLRMAQYQTGGGVVGNRPAGTIVQLKTTVPYVDKVTNLEPAAGGAEAESHASLLERAPRELRHRQRAVTREDYEDLAMLASPEVARALCVPLFDLAQDPDASQSKSGVVSLIIVPRSGRKPAPGMELISRVQSYLDAHRYPAMDLVIVGPDYVRVDVEAELAVATLEGAGEVEQAAQAALARFLHPLTGGLAGEGWAFGRKPHKSDLYLLLEALAGVDHVRKLVVRVTPDRDGAEQSQRFLVYSGTHLIRLLFEES